MPIYNRDNINYGSLIQNAIANRNAAAQRDAGYITNFGNIVGGAVSTLGNQIGRGLVSYEEDEDEAKLKELEAERELLIKKEKENAANAMEGYRPATVPNYTPFEVSLDGYNVNSDIKPTENNPYLPAINQYYRRGR